MEPYRAYVDEIVYELFNERDYYILHHENKEKLLKVLVCDTKIGTVKRPLMIALTYTTASIAKVVNKKSNYLALPKME
jgi:CRISPR-associated protein Cas1